MPEADKNVTEKEQEVDQEENHSDDQNDNHGDDSGDSPGDDRDTTAEREEQETRARRQGWVPKERYRGNPEQWRDAGEFLKKAETELPVANHTIRQLERQIQDMDTSFQKMKKFSEIQAKSTYERAIEDLRKEQRKAVSEADEDAFIELEKKRDKLEQIKPEPEPEPVKQNAIPREVQEWVSNNSWFTEDDEMRALASTYESKITHVPLEERLRMVKKRVMERFPEKFDNPNRKKTTVDGSSSVHTGAPKKKTARDLPREVIADANKMIRSGDYKDLDAFAKDYFSMYGDKN